MCCTKTPAVLTEDGFLKYNMNSLLITHEYNVNSLLVLYVIVEVSSWQEEARMILQATYENVRNMGSQEAIVLQVSREIYCCIELLTLMLTLRNVRNTIYWLLRSTFRIIIYKKNEFVLWVFHLNLAKLKIWRGNGKNRKTIK